MPIPFFDPNARRKTISITINSDLAARASALGINLSRTAEAAIAAVFVAAEREQIKEEIAEAVRLTDEYVAKHGHPFAEFIADYLPMMMTMKMQHDLFVNPSRAMRRTYPLVADLQADLVASTHRITAPMAPLVAFQRRNEAGLLPVVVHDEQDYLMLLTLLTSLPAHLLRNAVGTVREFRFEITRGLDWLFSGI